MMEGEPGDVERVQHFLRTMTELRRKSPKCRPTERTPSPTLPDRSFTLSLPDSVSLPLTISADAKAEHQHVVTAMDVAGRLGFTQISIATVNDPVE